MKYIEVLAIGLFLFSCSSPAEPERSGETKFSDASNAEKVIRIPEDLKDKTAASSENDPENPYYKYNTVLKTAFNDSVYAHFSDLKGKDFFTFHMPAGNIDSTESVLRIYSPKGDLIYEKKFVTSYMINGYDLEFIKNETEMQKYMLKKANSMLDKFSFTNLSNVDKYSLFSQMKPEDYENYAVYLECKKDKRPVFGIGLAEEDVTFIGFSKKQQKVVDIIYCC